LRLGPGSNHEVPPDPLNGELGCRAGCAAFDTSGCTVELSFGLEGFGTDSRFAYAAADTPEVLIQHLKFRLGTPGRQPRILRQRSNRQITVSDHRPRPPPGRQELLEFEGESC